jgi:hypothetical protein
MNANAVALPKRKKQKLLPLSFARPKESCKEKDATNTNRKAKTFSGIRFIYSTSLRFTLFVDISAPAGSNIYLNNMQRNLNMNEYF